MPRKRPSSPTASATSASCSASSCCSGRPAPSTSTSWRPRAANGTLGLSGGMLTAAVLCLFCGAVGKIGPVPAARLAARRHGRPDARLRPHPRRHHGRRRCLHAGPDFLPHRPARRADRRPGHRLDRRHHRPARRAHGHAAERHQTHPRLLDALAARLHGHGRRPVRPASRVVPPFHPRVFQGAALPRRRRGHPCLPSRAGHLENGRALEKDAAHLPHLPRRHRRPCRRALRDRRLLLERGHPRRGLGAKPRALLARRRSSPSSPLST